MKSLILTHEANLNWFVRCGVLTVEIEHVDAATLEKLEKHGVDCQPKASTIRIIQVFVWTVKQLCYASCKA